MSEMVERVAKAICEAGGGAWRKGTYLANFDADQLNNHWRHKALAAIKAMREPTKEMVDAAYGEITSRIESDGSDLFEAWRAAIDAVLPTPEKDKDDGR